MKILLLGGGYVLTKLAKKLETEFVITSTKKEKVDGFKNLGYQSVLLDIRDKAAVDKFFKQNQFDIIIDSIPPIAAINVFNAIEDSLPKKFFYLSTTGVYGEQDGGVVTEDSPTNPLSSKAEARLETEQLYRQLHSEVTCFRISAISGPERNPINSIKTGRYPYIEDGSKYTNRIHVDDLVSVLLASINHPEKLPEIINCSSGKSYKTSELFDYVSNHFSLEKPKSITMEEVRARGMHTLLGNQQVSNELLLSIFPGVIKYPDLDWMIKD